jgi:excinuclease UvrABC nuclease subunit
MRNAPRPPDWAFLDAQIDQLTVQKEDAVGNEDFVTAAELRDQIDQLQKRKEEIARCWNEQAKEVVGVVDRETVVEVQRLMNGSNP